MVSDSWEGPLGSDETYDAFGDSSEHQARTSSESLPLTEKATRDPRTAPAWGAGAGPEPDSGPGWWPSSAASFPRPASARAGDEAVLFGKYRPLRQLGGGGMGDVWLVEHIGLGIERALKVIKANLANGNPTSRLRFQREAQILAQLGKHPNAVVVHDFGIDGDEAYIEMEFLDGQTLSKWLKAKPGSAAPVEDVLWFLRELCQVMGEAHRLGIVHRDIKPGNIMIVPEPGGERGERVKVLDFGIAKIIREAGGETASVTMQTQGYVGTLPYSSPEQLGIDGDGQEPVPIDHRSDIYSIGVLLYEMLSGIQPFTGSPTKILYDHAYTMPAPIATRAPGAHVPEAVEKVVMRCLEKQPANRPQSARELYESFARAVPRSLLSQPPGELADGLAEASSLGDEKTSAECVATHLPSMLTQIGLPSFLPRRAILRLFLGLAVGAGIISGLLVLYLFPFLGPGPKTGPGPAGPPTTVARAAVPEWVKVYLGSRGFQQAEGAETDPEGWPLRIGRTAIKGAQPLVLRGTVYLPEKAEYAAGPEGVNADGLPRVLVRAFDQTRFVLIEGGEFEMGAWEDPHIHFLDEEKPGHLVEVPSYYMQETEVTCKEIRDYPLAPPKDDPAIHKFWIAREHLRKRMEEPEWERRPAVGISRRLAEDYAHYVGGELPTEPQWEYAARSRGQKRPYVWPGDKVRESNGEYRARVFSAGQPIDILSVRLPESDRTEQGVHGLAGNVREWCRDVWQHYPPRPLAAGPDAAYVIRGGSFETPPETVRVTWRRDVEGQAAVPYKAENDRSFLDVGFRVVLEALAKRSAPEGPLASGPSREGAP